jgi:subtilisin-like proprotein convertase family protein
MRFNRLAMACAIIVLVLSLNSCWLLFNLPTTETYTGSGGTIGAGASEFTLEIPVAAEVRDIEGITLNGLDHPDSSDLLIQLEAPGGLKLDLSANRGTGDQEFDGTYTFVDRETADAVNIYVADATGTIVPASYWSDTDLDEFDEKDVRGTWKLVFYNNGATGSLDNWALELTYKEY